MKRLLLLVMMLFSFVIADTELGGVINTANTKASQWTSPVTGEHYYYSGSYNFTFKTTKSYAPWLNVGAPGLSVGCAGISLKGGFLSLLGLNEIKDQLANAGAQLAWGVMIGLVYSMPGIGDVFMKIQKWARAIQKLLANMCNIGQKLGEAFAKNLYNSDTAKQDAQSWINNKMSGVTGALDNLSKWTDNLNSCLTSGESVDLKNGCGAKANQIKSKKTAEIGFSIVGESVTNSIVNSRLKLTTTPNNQIYIGTLKELIDNGQVNGRSIATLSDDEKSALELNLLFFGDKALPTKDARDLIDHTDCNGELNKNKICKPKINKGKLANETEGIPLPDDLKPTTINPILKPLQAAQALLHGFSSQTDSHNCNKNGYCYIPNYLTIYVNITGKQNSDGGTAKPIQYFTITSQDSGDNKIAVHWKGAIQESLEKVRAYVKDNSGITPSIPSTDETVANVNKGSIIPLFVPGIGKYIKIIGQIEKKAKKETMFTASLKELLAKYNAFLFAKYLISMEEANILASVGDSSSSSGGSADSQLQQLREIKAEIQKELDAILKENNYFKDIADIFKEIEIDYRKNITKNF